MTRVAYLNTRYPAISHTFIEREVRAVRARGVEVHTFSIRRPEAIDLMGRRSEEAARTTAYVLEAGRMARGVARALLRRPGALLRTIAEGQRLSPPGVRARLLHCAYALEAAVLAGELRARALRHVHVHMANNGAAVALLATVFDPSLSYSLTIHGSAEFFDVKGCSLKQKAERARFVRCISNFCRAQVMAWSAPDAWARFHVVHCGIDADDFSPKTRGIEDATLKVLTVGRLDPIKGYDLLLEACRRLMLEGAEVRVRMVGEGPQRRHLEARVLALGLEEVVQMVGAAGQEALEQHYEWADVMVVSSFMEGIPVVLMEAMAKELAVIAPRIAGIPELVDDGDNGLLATPASVEDLVRLLRKVAADPGAAGSMGRKARDRIVERFSIRDVGAGMADLFARHAIEDSEARAAAALEAP